MILDGLIASRYRVLKTLGSGGMGVVYLVEDTHEANRRVALKTLNASGDAEAEAAFRAEFRNVRGVAHPNIPTVFDFGVLREAENLLYFTCEFVEGRSLDTLLERWSPSQLRHVLVEVCRAMAFLHSRGLLHRDVKPENVLARLEENGDVTQVKLTDFGLAAFAHEARALSGTLDYLAPEVMAGEPASTAADLYALGILIFKLATGRFPFEAESLAAAKQRASAEAPSPLRFRPELPVGLADVISELIRLKPEERPASARHVIALLNEREGTNFPYETPVTRTAYIHSAASVTHSAVRARLQNLKDDFLAGRPVPTVIITGAAGLGRARLLRDLAAELTLAGVSVRFAGKGDDVQGDPAASVTIVPQWRELGFSLANAFRTGEGDHGWLILSRDAGDAVTSAVSEGTEILTLLPLRPEEVKIFVDATFPGNNFPPEFHRDLHSRTLGFPAALQSVLSELLRLELLQIDLHGWQLMPTPWTVPQHPHVKAWVARSIAVLPAATREQLKVLALSEAALPDEILRGIEGTESCSDPEGFDELVATGWIERTDHGTALIPEAVREVVVAGLPESERQRIHTQLLEAWQHPALVDHPDRREESLYHDWQAAVWRLSASEAEEILNSVLARGRTKWVRRLAESSLSRNAPLHLRPVILRILADVDYAEGDLESASARFAELLEGGNAALTDESLAAFARYAMIEEKLGRPEHAAEILEKCLHALPEGQDPRAGLIYGTRAWIEFRRGEGDEARRWAEEGLARIPPGTADLGYAMLLNTVATLSFYRGDMDAARLFWTCSLEIHQTLNDRKGLATLYNNLGVLAAQSGDRLRARSLWEQCATIAREIGDIGRLAGIYNNLGIDSLESGALSDAEQNYMKALALFRRMNSPREQVSILSNLGELAFYRADFMRAQSYWREAIELAVSLGDQEAQLEPQVYLAKLNITLDNLTEAEKLLTQALPIAHESGSSKAEGQTREGLAMIHALRADSDQADAELQRAHSLLSEETDPLAHLHLHLTECEVAAGRRDSVRVEQALAEARKVADTKWDPFAAARMLVDGLLFAHQKLDNRERARNIRQLSVYPEIMWRFHWGMARQRLAEGAARKALDEFGRGVAVLKGIADRLSEEARNRYLNSPSVRAYKAEVLKAKQQAAK